MSRSHVRVRPAEPADAARLAAIVESTEPPLGPLAARQLRAETLRPLAERFAAVIATGERMVLVAVEDATGDVVGLAVLAEVEVGAVSPVAAVSVSHLVVARRHRRRGVGRALLAATVHVADQRGIDHVVASAGSGSRDANRYLARLGFAPLVVRRIAATSVLHRSLGITDGTERLALLRRLRGGGARPPRPGFANRSVSRGA